MTEDEAALLEELRAISAKSTTRRFTAPNDEDRKYGKGGKSDIDNASSRETSPGRVSSGKGETPTDATCVHQPNKPEDNHSALPESVRAGLDSRTSSPSLATNQRTLKIPYKSTKQQNPSTDEGSDVVVQVTTPSRNACDNNEELEKTAFEEETRDKDCGNISSNESTRKSMGFKQPVGSTFVGSRGGDATDDELLAELRAVSSRSASSSRFKNSGSTSKKEIHLNSTIGGMAIADPIGNDASPVKANLTAKASVVDGAFDRNSPRQPIQPKQNKSPEAKPWRKAKPHSGITASPNDASVQLAIPSPIAENKSSAVESKVETNVELNKNLEGSLFSQSVNTNVAHTRSANDADHVLLAELRAVPSRSELSNKVNTGEASERDTPQDTVSSIRNLSGNKTVSPTKSLQLKSSNLSISEDDRVATETGHAAKTEKSPTFKQRYGAKQIAQDADTSNETSRQIDALPGKRLAEVGGKGKGRLEDTNPESLLSNNLLNAKKEKIGFKQSAKSSFSGDRGGEAIDDELLAELRAVSSRSSSAKRFASSVDLPEEYIAPRGKVSSTIEEESPSKNEISLSKKMSNSHSRDELATVPATTSMSHEPNSEILTDPTSWRQQAKNNMEVGHAFDSDAFVAIPAGKVHCEENCSKAFEPKTSSIVAVDSSLPIAPARKMGFKQPKSSFSGDRGGEAVDEELLAELRAVSSRSTSGSRFASKQGSDQSVCSDFPGSVEVPALETRLGTGKNAGFSSNSKILASNDKRVALSASSVSPSSARQTKQKKSAEPKPWAKAQRVTKDIHSIVETDVSPGKLDGLEHSEFRPVDESPSKPKSPENATSLSSIKKKKGFKQSTNSAFAGDRVKDAVDEELLAELRAVSSSSTTRFAASEGYEKECGLQEKVNNRQPACRSNVKNSQTSPISQHITLEKSSCDSRQISSSEIKAVADADAAGEQGRREIDSTTNSSESMVKFDELPNVLSAKDWKVRKASYELLRSHLCQKNESGNNDRPRGMGNAIGSDSIISDFDSLIIVMLKDSNAIALDSALELALVYANLCSGASEPENASKIIRSLLDGHALASSRLSTGKSTRALIMILMEVGHGGPSSIHSIIETLVKDGLRHRKPKVVIAAASIIVDTAEAFGVAYLPLHVVQMGIPIMLSHSNAAVRELGVKLTAVLCSSVGSKETFSKLIETMKTTQVAHLDSLLASSLLSSKPTRKLRYVSNEPACVQDVLSVVHASRPAVNIFKEISKSDYSLKLQASKWSEKVAGLDVLLNCGGAKPYKLVQPSAAVNYNALVSEMKKLIGDTHFAVNSKAMSVLSMLAEGVGEKLLSCLRPLVPVLLSACKDKKLTVAAGHCLDTLFGNVLSFENLLGKEDAIASAIDEKREKNALARTSAMEFLKRCVEHRNSAKAKSTFESTTAARVASLAVKGLNDLDPGPRKVAADILFALWSIDDKEIRSVINKVIEDLKGKHARVYKALATRRRGGSSYSPKDKLPLDENTMGSRVESKECSEPLANQKSVSKSALTCGSPTETNEETLCSVGTDSREESQGEVSTKNQLYADAEIAIQQLGIPKYNAAADDGGVLAGLKSSNWKQRKQAIEALTIFIENGSTESDSRNLPLTCVIVLVKEHTKDFQEANTLVVKSLLELMFTVLQAFLSIEQVPEKWICQDIVNLSTNKLADRKNSSLACNAMSTLCLLLSPADVTKHAVSVIETIKSPISHEALLAWMLQISQEFGAHVLTASLTDVSCWLSKECGCAQPAVRSAALAVVGELHSQLGPPFRARLLSDMKTQSPAAGSQIDRCFEQCPFDPVLSNIKRPKCCLALKSLTAVESFSSDVASDITRQDIMSLLPTDCLSRMGKKEGKTAWKTRKAALEDVALAIEKCGGLICCSECSVPGLLDLTRALRDRVSDSQSNLKPQAATILGDLLSSVDESTQARLGKEAFPSLLYASVTDSRIQMREAALLALDKGTKKVGAEGGEPNSLSLQVFLSALVTVMKELEEKATGLPSVLAIVQSKIDILPKASNVRGSRAHLLEQELTQQLVYCWTSKRPDTRHSSCELIKECVRVDVLRIGTIKHAIGKLLPAQQQSVKALLVKMLDTLSPAEKENPINMPESKSQEIANLSPSNVKRRMRTANDDTRTSTDSSPLNEGLHKKLGQSCDASSTLKMSSKGIDSQPRPTPSDVLPLSSAGSSCAGSTKEQRMSLQSRQRDSWPEYPEQPDVRIHLEQLKKAWASMLPLSSVDILFPPEGVNKQDDCVSGAKLLSSILGNSSSENNVDDAIVDQLDLILKWLSIALSSRETTSGLQSLLGFMEQLFEVIQDRRYVLSDFEAGILLPFLVERKSMAKGRFRLLFGNLITRFTATRGANFLYPPQNYGPQVCVIVAERSAHAKARLLALSECQRCIEQVGLSGIGKKGIFVACRAVSDEPLQENRACALDAICAVISKMNGNIQRFINLCGTHLSENGGALVRDHWSKFDASSSTLKGSQDIAPVTSPRGPRVRTSHVGATRRGIVASDRAKGDNRNVVLTGEDELNNPSRHQEKQDTTIPRLTLNLKKHSSPISPLASDKGYSAENMPDEPFKFTFSELATKENIQLLNSSAYNKSTGECSALSTDQQDRERRTSDCETRNSLREPQVSGAASLRARLKIIRDRHTVGTASSSSVNSDAYYDSLKTYNDLCLTMDSFISESTNFASELIQGNSYSQTLGTVRLLYSCIVDTQGNDMKQELRRGIFTDISGCVERLTSLFKVALVGNSCPALLSATTDVLTAIYRDKRLALMVPQSTLKNSLRCSCEALLDSRFASPIPVDVNVLDADARLVKAINKLAIQAAIGTSRTCSLATLMSLQQEYCEKSRQPLKNEGIMYARRSRIITKLFARVIRSEESSQYPFRNASTMNLNAIFTVAEGVLQNVSNCEITGSPTGCNFASAIELVKLLMHAIANAYGAGHGGEAVALGCVLAQNDFDLNSRIGCLICKVFGAVSAPELKSREGEFAAGTYTDCRENKRQISVVETADENEHAAIETNSDSASKSPINFENSTNTRKARDTRSTKVSERLRLLKSKLSATEAVVRSTEESSGTDLVKASLGCVHVVDEYPSASAFAVEKSSTDGDDLKSSTIGQRLEVARESKSEQVDLTTSTVDTSGSNHAVALRARLEAMKRKGQGAASLSDNI